MGNLENFEITDSTKQVENLFDGLVVTTQDRVQTTMNKSGSCGGNGGGGGSCAGSCSACR